MKWFSTILLTGILSLLSITTVAAQKEFPVSILFDSVKILPPATLVHINRDDIFPDKQKEKSKLEISHYLDNRFSLGLATGYSSLND